MILFDIQSNDQTTIYSSIVADVHFMDFTQIMQNKMKICAQYNRKEAKWSKN